MKDKMGNTEAERRATYYDQPWCYEAVPRYFYAKVSQSLLYSLADNNPQTRAIAVVSQYNSTRRDVCVLCLLLLVC